MKSRANEPRAESTSSLDGYAEAMYALNRKLRANGPRFLSSQNTSKVLVSPLQSATNRFVTVGKEAAAYEQRIKSVRYVRSGSGVNATLRTFAFCM